MNRNLILKIHFILAAFIFPFLLLMPLSGTLYLFGIKGSESVDYKFSISGKIPSELKEQEGFFRDVFQIKDPGFKFEYIKKKGDKFIFRPSSRIHYRADKEGDEIRVFQVTPGIQKRLIELHKGHGPRMFKNLEKFAGAGILLLALSGLLLGITLKQDRSKMLIAAGLGFLIFTLALFI